MLTQRVRERDTLQVKYPSPNKQAPATEVNPATVQLDYYIRSPEMDQRNHPTPQVFDYFLPCKSRGSNALDVKIAIPPPPLWLERDSVSDPLPWQVGAARLLPPPILASRRRTPIESHPDQKNKWSGRR